MKNHRPERVADQVRRLLGGLLREIRDPRIGLVTLTDVRLSPDLRHARVFVTILEQPDRDAALASLNGAAPFLRRSLARKAGLRFTPELKFFYDEGVDRGLRVEAILDDLRRDWPEDEAEREEPI